jgi:hypothetical protein
MTATKMGCNERMRATAAEESALASAMYPSAKYTP